MDFFGNEFFGDNAVLIPGIMAASVRRFGARSPAGYLLDHLGSEPSGMALDCVAMGMLVRGGGLNWKGDPNGKLTYTAPSTKWITNRHGVLSGGTTLRCDHDASTLDTSATTHDSLGVGNGGVVRKTITTSGAVTYVAGQDIVASDASDIAKWMAGRVVSYAGGSLVVDFRAASGYFTCSSWKIIVALGLLVEEQRTNLFVQSGFASDWSLFGNTMPVSSELAPDGSYARKLVEKLDASPSFQHQIQQSRSVTAGTPHAWSVFAKAAERSRFALAGVSTSAVFDLSSATVVSGPGTIASVGNGWFRCSVVGTPSSTPVSPYIRMYSGAFDTYTGDGTSGMYFWGIQLETGSFPTSYIPTTGAQVTRAADAISLATSAFPFNTDEGVLYAKARAYNSTPNQSGSPVPVILDSGATANMIPVYRVNGTNEARFQVSSSNSVVAQLAAGTWADGATGKLAGAYKANDFAASFNGGAAVTDTSGAVPTGISSLNIGRVRTNSWWNSHVQEIVYLPRRASNSDLQTWSAL